jgi:hypothetical protein
MNTKKPSYTPPTVKTLEGREILGSLGPVSAGSGNNQSDCIPASWMGGC